ncbi:hypothetical protein BIY23_01885 [Wolbachia pipientis]|uniref:Uncharacterized protein n=1 Tax=Wolbachia pipientis TaxID=955 RepID=A0A1E7QJV8_WOLPI|nr:hypothetical protein [Wolbachia pipientis]OEY86765.1 hypothetical protein BIY23_01885 [Wolbachia pipientis]
MNKCDSNILNLLLTALLLLSNLANAKDVIVGLITGEEKTKFESILNNLGAKTILIEKFSEHDIDKVVKEQNINRIFVVGQERPIKIAENIRLLSICSNLQNIINIKEVVSNKTLEQLRQIKIVPNSHLEKIISKFLIPDKSGWVTICLNNCTANQVNNNIKNRKTLESLGYKIAGFSDNGTIEAIEDKHRNIYLAGTIADSSVQQTLIEISILYDFLYS